MGESGGWGHISGPPNNSNDSGGEWIAVVVMVMIAVFVIFFLFS